jgi:hypothetical protein
MMHKATTLEDKFYATRRDECGRKKIWDLEELSEAHRALPAHVKTSERDIAAALGVPKIMVNRLKKAGLASWHSSRVKPQLTQKHKDDRLFWCLSMIDKQTVTMTRSPFQYQEMYDLVHIDEKWFNLKKTKMGFILAPGEEKYLKEQQSIRATSKRYSSLLPLVVLIMMETPVNGLMVR